MKTSNLISPPASRPSIALIVVLIVVFDCPIEHVGIIANSRQHVFSLSRSHQF